ncbi:ATP-binding protein [Micromonospora sp. NBC_00898]|uniref:ATP-binding protein n=1 Tax=Micromonospora sp. NBC_00898 TaxID=2975981 RepID=UPI00386CD161
MLDGVARVGEKPSDVGHGRGGGLGAGLPVQVSRNHTDAPIAPEAVAGLFEPFRRLRDRTGDGGFGLGLAIVASIATAHGGEAAAGALPDGGLSVTVSLPARTGPPG